MNQGIGTRGSSLLAIAVALLAVGSLVAGCDGDDGPGYFDPNAGGQHTGDAGGDASGGETDTDTGEDADTDTGGTDTGEDADVPPVASDTVIQGQVVLARNYPNNIHTGTRAYFGSSGLADIRLFVRFCEDEACEQPLAVQEARIDEAKADKDFHYILSTGFPKAFTIANPPLGASYYQLIGRTRVARELGAEACDSTESCPADFDVLMVDDDVVIDSNNDGLTPQPPAVTFPIEVSEGDTLLLETVHQLGHLNFDRTEINAPASPDPGSLLIAMSGEGRNYRNRIARVDLDDTSADPGKIHAEYNLQKGDADFLGDICGLIPGGGAIWAVGVDNDGAHIFKLNADGTQADTEPVASMAPDGDDYPWPCRGVYAQVNGTERLYLIQYAGAGAKNDSKPYGLYNVNLSTGTFTGDNDTADNAYGGIVWSGESLVLVDMSWSKYSSEHYGTNTLFVVHIDANGEFNGNSSLSTSYRSHEQCEATNHWRSDLLMANLGSGNRILMGHDEGIAIFDWGNPTAPPVNIDLRHYGRLISQIVPSHDGQSFFALPQCKSSTHFQLADSTGYRQAVNRHLLAQLDIQSGNLVEGGPEMDFDSDGNLERGIDLGFLHIKSFMTSRTSRSFGALPPITYTGPQIAVGRDLIALRGSGIQGSGSTLSSSGLGQVQTIGIFDIHSRQGVVYGDYTPWIDGVSSEAGSGGGIWGYDMTPGWEASTGAILYLP